MNRSNTYTGQMAGVFFSIYS